MRHCHALVMLLLVLSWATVGLAQTHSPTKDDVTEEMRRIYAALDSGKPEAILQTPNEGVGFGWRAAAPRSNGDVGLAWGVHVEDFKIKGRLAESARVRFTQVLKKEGDHWRSLLYHRDIQPFDGQGHYLTQFTTSVPTRRSTPRK